MDALQGMKSIPDKAIDLVLTDPPYNLGEISTGNMNMPNHKEINNDIAKWDVGFDPVGFLKEASRILKPEGQIYIFTAHRLFGTYFDYFEKHFERQSFMVWHKTNPTPKWRRCAWLPSCELIIYAYNDGKTFNFTTQNDMHNFYESPIVMGNDRTEHPTQKPLDLFQKIIITTTNSGDVVLDPFLGSGTTLRACRETGRVGLGFEINPEYEEIICKRSLQDIPDITTYGAGSNAGTPPLKTEQKEA
jgi:site-specific DNA-methyltransferase (adenine-specific)/modification methylase